MRKSLVTGVVGVLFTTTVAVLGFNYATAFGPMRSAIADDPRNAGIAAYAYHQYLLDPSVLVIDIRGIGDTIAPTDVTRLLLQFAAKRKEATYKRVILATRGTPKLQFEGSYFKTLGEEFGTQNPMYTIRTMPENTYDLDGKQAFGTWTGGVLGVLSKQMEDVVDLHKRWYIEDLSKAQ